jgi:PIN domain nuclease of toxin-antitoxin system
MKLLLDTHTFIWWDSDADRLSPRSRTALEDHANELFLSVVSIWEIVIKTQLKKLSVRLPIETLILSHQLNGIQLLDVRVEDVYAVQSLPDVHKDPFDRVLAAQSLIEDALLVTADAIFASYPIRTFW